MAGGAAGGFVTRAFESMFKECGRKYPDLKKSIQAYQDITKVSNQERTPQTEYGTGTITSVLASVGQTLEGPYVQLVLNPLRLSLETKNWKIMEPALDCLHKLIAYDHLEGDPGEDGGKNDLLFTEILNMVCGCVDNSSPSSTSLQVLKVLLTAVSSTKFRVHGDPLLNIVRVCYNIAVNSASPTNQNTAKAMLTQTVTVTFRRMETGPVGASASGEHAPGRNTKTTATEKYLSTKSDDTSTGDPDDKAIPSGDAARQVKDTTLKSAEELQNFAGGADVKGFEAALDKAVRKENARKVTRMDLAERDAFLVFRTLCKRGMKEENDEVTTKTRILSLELLQGLLEGFSDSFTKNFDFVDSVKSYLSYSVLRASVSKSPVIFQYATDIFVLLLLRFRQSLKGEIGIIFPLVVLRTLDGLESPIDRKRNVLRMLGKVCKDPQMLIDIFVNYDCDPEAPNIFERMVTSLSKIAQGTENIDPNSVAMSPTVSIKGSSLQCLVNVLNSLGEWEKERRKSKKQGEIAHSHQEGVAAAESVETNSREGATGKFEKENDHKSTLDDAISKFNRQPKKGVEYMISNKLVEKEAASVAQFFKIHNLDKNMIGDYLGENEEFPIAVLHAYFDAMNFSGMKFDTAIREFLKEFRLPGEAQKIDRIMEKFAERYYACNPGLFQSADAAYVIAYAVIMLNADAHDPTVWPKMSKSDFSRLTVMDDVEESAPTELLEEVYDSIVKEAIKMNDDLPDTEKISGQNAEAEAQRHVRILNLALPRRKSPDDAKSESEGIIKKTQAVFTKEDAKRGVFYASQQIELVRPMVEAVCWPLLATFSVTMEEVDNMPWIILSMEGFKAGIHITYVLGMDTLRYAFLTSLIRFTFLHAPRDMRVKNLEALRTLLVLCELEPESLQETWNAVLECVSRLEFITTTPSISAVVMLGANQISRDAVVQSLRDLAGKPAELVFTGSVGLPSAGAVEFFTALSGVSAEELKQSPPRIFSLQKLVEISYHNMSRIRMVWARIWSVLAKHFVSAGSHSEQKIAMYAIDSLRQIGIKYLERAELANFTFQNDILRPFVLLMRNCPYESTRRLILDCIVKMIKSKVGSIRSGWRSIFLIFSAAADDESESIVEKAFENVEQILLEHFGKIVGDCFTDCVNCLIKFAANKKLQRISLKAIALLRICEDRLAEGIIPGGTKKPVDANADSNFYVAEHYWFPMLAGLSELTSDPRHEIRNCAREVLFDLVNERGNKFSASCWENIFHRVLFPIVDQARQFDKEGALSSDDEWLRETSIHSLQLLCDLFSTFYKEVSFMLPPLLSLLLDCAKKMDQSVVSISLGALMHIIEIGGDQFSESDWDTLLTSIRDASSTTQPLELLNDSNFETAESEAQPLVPSDGATVNSGDNESADHHKNNAGDNGRAPLVLPRNDEHKESGMQMSADRSEGLISKNLMYFIIYGLPPPDSESNGGNEKSGLQKNTGAPSMSGRVPKPTERRLERNQTIGQKIMGNMMDNLFFRNLTSQPKNRVQNASVLSNPDEERAVEPDRKDKEENPKLRITRGKCITQLLLLCAIDDIQKKYWSKLGDEQKIAIMEILFSLLEFSASYNSFTKLGSRMHQTRDDKPPLNLLRQELAATTIYLDTLRKSTSGFNAKKEENLQSDDRHTADTTIDSGSRITKHDNADEKLERIAEEKLVSFCQQALKEASDFHSIVGERTDMHMHRVLDLRSPVTVKVLKGMRDMNSDIFRRHLREFYPLLIKLVCCDQIDVRGALDDLFQTQLIPLLP